jgi:hypothetical protein
VNVRHIPRAVSALLPGLAIALLRTPVRAA